MKHIGLNAFVKLQYYLFIGKIVTLVMLASKIIKNEELKL